MRRSCTPTWTRSSPRSSSVTTPGCAASRSSSAAGWCWRPATRPRPAVCAARWAASGRSACAPTRSWWSRGCRPTPRRARTSSRSSAAPPRWSRGCRSTRPSWTSVGCAGSPAARRRSRPGSAPRCWPRSGCGSPSGWPGRSSWPRSPARWPNRTACWWCRRVPNSTSCIRLPVQRLWGVGPKSTEKLHDIGIYTVGQVAAMGEAGLVSILGPASGRHLHALAHNRDPRSVRVGHRRRSIGSQHAMGRSRHLPSDIDAVVVGLVDRVTRRMRDADRTGRTVMLRLRFDDFSRVSRSRTLLRATSQTDVILGAVRGLVAAAMPMIEKQGLTLVGHRGRQPGRRELAAAGAAVRRTRPEGARLRTGQRAGPIRLGRRHPGRADGAPAEHRDAGAA